MLNKHFCTLELDKVLKHLSSFASLSDAKEAIQNIVPSTDIGFVREALSMTDEAFQLSAGYGTPSFGFAHNVSNSLTKAQNGGTLSIKELMDIGEVLRSVRSLCEWRSRCASINAVKLQPLFDSLISNKYFEDKIFISFISEDEVDDNASTELATIRRKMRSAALNVRDRLDKMIKSQSHSKHLQDAIVTQRDGRFVVPVKTEYRSEIPGLVHDTSSSGATLFVEPMAVVEINNELRMLKSKEKDEIERILASFSAEVAGFAPNIADSYDVLIKLCIVFAKSSMAYDMRASVPLLNDNGEVYLKNARHPLLDKKTVVPITVGIGDENDTLVITGPNTGGKTVTIKTIGLLTLMTMCGMMIPVSDNSKISIFKNVFADIGDEQSIEQSLSTFSSHMMNIISILNEADDKSLVLIDELGAGTDPVEGAALATAILMKLREKGTKIAATTHYAELKTFAIETFGVCNASCEFDVNTLKPTYKLIIGIPGRSNAFAISEKLGLSKNVVSLAQSLVSDDDVRFEKVVAKLEYETKKAEQDRQDVAILKSQLAEMNKSQNARMQEINKEKEKIIQKAREQASAIVDKTRNESQRILGELEDASKKSAHLNQQERIKRARAEMKSGLNKLYEISDPINSKDKISYTLPRKLKKGDTIEIIDIGKQGTVIEDPKENDVMVLAGIIKTRVSLDNLKLVETKKPEIKKYRSNKAIERVEKATRTAASELDLRGMNSEEAIMDLDRFIDNSIMAGLGSVWIIHGKGTGVLRKSVHAYLKTNKSVKSYRLGLYGEGEDGITVAELL